VAEEDMRARGGDVMRGAIVALIVEYIFLGPHDETKGKVRWTRKIRYPFHKDPIPIEGREGFDLHTREGKGERERERERGRERRKSQEGKAS
jgi:hypothetical protein